MRSATQCFAEYNLTEEEQGQADGRKSVIVAVRSGHLLATAFHPELTDDTRWCVHFCLPLVAGGTAGGRAEHQQCSTAAHCEHTGKCLHSTHDRCLLMLTRSVG